MKIIWLPGLCQQSFRAKSKEYFNTYTCFCSELDGTIGRAKVTKPTRTSKAQKSTCFILFDSFYKNCKFYRLLYTRLFYLGWRTFSSLVMNQWAIKQQGLDWLFTSAPSPRAKTKLTGKRIPLDMKAYFSVFCISLRSKHLTLRLPNWPDHFYRLVMKGVANISLKLCELTLLKLSHFFCVPQHFWVVSYIFYCSLLYIYCFSSALLITTIILHNISRWICHWIKIIMP